MGRKEEKLLSHAREQYDDGEETLAAVLGMYETTKAGEKWHRSGILIATNRRILFFAKKIGGFELASYPYDMVTSIEQGKGLTGHKVVIYSAGGQSEVKHISDSESLSEFMSAAQRRMKGDSPAAEEPTGSDASPVMEQLRQLGDLRDAGVLSEDEFAEKKAELLKRL